MEELPQPRPPSRISGTTGELMVAVELLRHGYTVSWPTSDIDGYDMISDGGAGALRRIQVKTCASPGTHRTYRVYFSKGTRKRCYTKLDCDYIVAVLLYPAGPSYYVIPVEATKGIQGVFWPPGQHPRWPDKWKTCKFEQYRDRWDQLR